MDTRAKTVFAGFLVISAFILSLTAAWTLFRYMESSADLVLRDWKFGGAFAGFVATFLILTNGVGSFFQMFSADQIREYLQVIEELQLKLVKGSPCPPGYVRDIDERNRLVFARPSTWREPSVIPLYSDFGPEYPAAGVPNFNVNIQDAHAIDVLYRQHSGKSFDPKRVDLDDLYAIFVSNIKDENIWKSIFNNYGNSNVAEEIFYLQDMKACKCIHYFESTENADPASTKIKLRQLVVAVWMEKRNAMLTITFTDLADRYRASTETFNMIINSLRFWN